MAARKKNAYYVVWNGINPGIYKTWKECQNQIMNFPNAKYRKYNSLDEAKEAYDHGPEYKPKKLNIQNPNHPDIIKNAIAVDAACSGNPGDMEYRGVYVSDGTEIFHRGPFKEGTNNVGEFLALVHILALLDKRNDNTTPIYSDSKIAMGWVKKRKAKTTLVKTILNKELFDLIERAEYWLHTHNIANTIIKWDTKNWGEIPADFGRK